MKHKFQSKSNRKDDTYKRQPEPGSIRPFKENEGQDFKLRENKQHSIDSIMKNEAKVKQQDAGGGSGDHR